MGNKTHFRLAECQRRGEGGGGLQRGKQTVPELHAGTNKPEPVHGFTQKRLGLVESGGPEGLAPSLAAGAARTGLPPAPPPRTRRGRTTDPATATRCSAGPRERVVLHRAKHARLGCRVSVIEADLTRVAHRRRLTPRRASVRRAGTALLGPRIHVRLVARGGCAPACGGAWHAPGTASVGDGGWELLRRASWALARRGRAEPEPRPPRLPNLGPESRRRARPCREVRWASRPPSPAVRGLSPRPIKIAISSIGAETTFAAMSNASVELINVKRPLTSQRGWGAGRCATLGTFSLPQVQPAPSGGRWGPGRPQKRSEI